MAISDVHREPPNPKKKIPAKAKNQAEIRSNTMLTPISASTTSIIRPHTIATAESIGDHTDIISRTRPTISKPISTIVEGKSC